jgi:superfamily II DNA/RNA helicase
MSSDSQIQSFQDLQLHPQLQAAVDKLGYAEPTPIQKTAMPSIMEGKDVAGLAQTGTGKTAAFVLPLMERILRSRQKEEGLSPEELALVKARRFPDWVAMNFILVLVPTRELAEQVYENVLKFGGDSGLRAVSVYGGVGYDKQKEGLRGGVEFVIATPGRLLDLYKDNVVDLKQVRGIVFDEADRMFDMGFKDDMKYILTRIPKDRQFMVFSATLNLDVLNTAYQFGAMPVEFNVSRDQAKAENVDDKIIHLGQDEKGAFLLALLRKHNPRQAIVFSNFKMNVPRITQFLNDNELPAVGISSLLTQSQRNRVMEQFKGDSDKNILVATDVAARGLDIKGVDMVVNFELPDDPENYVHRIGRTGRAGANGIAYSLVSDRDVDALARVEGYLKHKVDTDFIDDAQIPKEFKAMSSDRGSKDFSREFRGEEPRRGREGGEGRRDGARRGGGGRDGGRDGGRRDGGRRDAGPRGGGRDGARRDGPRPQRDQGPRDPNASANGPTPVGASGHGSSAGAAGGGPRRHENRNEGRRHGQGSQGQGRGRDRDRQGNGQGGGGQGGHGQGGNGQGRRHDGRRSEAQGKRHDGPSGKRGHGGADRKKIPPPNPMPSKNDGIGKKVAGFFKRLIGS